MVQLTKEPALPRPCPRKSNRGRQRYPTRMSTGMSTAALSGDYRVLFHLSQATCPEVIVSVVAIDPAMYMNPERRRDHHDVVLRSEANIGAPKEVESSALCENIVYKP